MTATTRRSTALQDIRDVLATHGRAPVPWAPPEQVIERLYQTLRARTEDEPFWRDLERLAARLEARRLAAGPADRREILAAGTIEALLGDLRAALRRGDGDERSLRQRALGALGATGLAAFLLLGGAACGDDEDTCDGAEGLSGDEARDYCDLWDLVDASDATEHQQDEMFQCISEMDGIERAALLEQFSAMTDEELASELARRTDTCASCNYDGDDDGCH